jgi:hypothetical protein
MILVTATRLPPSWVAIDPQKLSAATTRIGLAGGTSVGVTGALVAVEESLVAVGKTLGVVGGAVVGEDATAVEVGAVAAPLQAVVSSVKPIRSARPRTTKADGP